ncbi:MAG: hypothetical protein JO001_25880 [Alphaproteobacteria bacterium]|nr:hypothetical protein [Alphaproteobacteria bacterium]
MKFTTPAMAAALLALGIGTAAAQQTQVNPAPLTAQGMGNPSTTPTVNPNSAQTQNPLVNPSAAGTQMNWKGSGSTSGAVTAHEAGSDNSGTQSQVTPGAVTGAAGQPVNAPSASPTAADVKTQSQARERLRQLGYTNVANVSRLGKTQWQATAQMDKRTVHVTLNEQGNVVGQR